AEAVGRTLARLGVRDAFGLIGSGNFAVCNALVAAGARFVAARHEGGAITMADAYARVSRRVGVCSVHQGPGLTNAVTGLAGGVKSGTPLLLLAGETAASALRSNFRIDQAGLVASVGAVAERLHGPTTAVADAARAYRRAEVERRPVVLMMPLDVQAADGPELDGTPPAPPALRPVRPAAAARAGAPHAPARAPPPPSPAAPAGGGPGRRGGGRRGGGRGGWGGCPPRPGSPRGFSPPAGGRSASRAGSPRRPRPS